MSTIHVEGNIRFKSRFQKDDEKLLAEIFTQTDHRTGIELFTVFDTPEERNVRGVIDGEFDVKDSMGKLNRKFADRWLMPLIKKDLIDGCKLYVEASKFEDWNYSFVYRDWEKCFSGYSEEDEEFGSETAIMLASDEELTSELWLRGRDVHSE